MKHRVTFKGPGREVEADHGENLLALARRVGIHIDSSCGGNGSCHQCRVVVHAGRENLQRAGKPASPRHTRDGEPVFLACQGEVRGDITVEAAPIHQIDAAAAASLEGWHVGAGRAFTVAEAGAITGGLYTVTADGALDAGRAFRSDEVPAADVLAGREIGLEHALRLGASHVPGASWVLDFAGRLLTPEGLQAAPTGAFLGDMPHLPGAVDSVAWSPLKTRTIITTVDSAAPAGVAASGVLACVHALLQSGMCDERLRLRESRFTRDVGAREAVIVAPDVEAQTPHGEIHVATRPLVLSQPQLDVMRAAADALAAMLTDCTGTLVVTGDYGTCVPPGLITALGMYAGPVVFVPHAAALGAARGRDVTR